MVQQAGLTARDPGMCDGISKVCYPTGELSIKLVYGDRAVVGSEGTWHSCTGMIDHLDCSPGF